MKKTDKDKLLKKLTEKLERIEDAYNATDKSSNVPDSLYLNFLTYISEYVDFLQKNPFLKKLNSDLLEVGINEQGNYPRMFHGHSYKKINKLNLAFGYKEDSRPLPKSKWNKPVHEVLKFTKAQRVQRINYKLLKQLEHGTYNGNNPFRPELGLELLSDEEFKAQKQSIIKEREGFNQRIAQFDARADKWMTIMAEAFNTASCAMKTFEHGSVQEKKVLLAKIGANFILKDKKLSMEAKKPYITFEKYMPMSHKLERQRGKLSKGNHQAKKAVSDQLETLWSG